MKASMNEGCGAKPNSFDEEPASRASAKRTLYVAIGFAMIGVISRVPFRSDVLHHWDSVNFALALEHFDVRLHQPHPPGTFVFYILFGRLFNSFLNDANASLVWVSIAATGLATACMFMLVTSWFSRRDAAIITSLMLSSPLVWFQGEVALSYMLEFSWVLLIAFVCLRERDVGRGLLYLSAALIGLAGGIRPNTPFFLFPLWLFVLINGLRQRRYSVKDLVIALILMAVGVTAWAVPMIAMSGGPAAYWDMLETWRAGHVEASGTAQGFGLHLARLGVFVAYATGGALLAIVYAILKNWRRIKETALHDWRAQSLAAWILPGLAYHVFIHVQQSGHTFTIMPVIIIIAGISVISLGRDLQRYNHSALQFVAFAVIALNGLLFLFGPADIFGPSRVTLVPPTRAAIQSYDNYVSERLEAIRKNFLPEETTVLADSRNFRLPDYYLRDYQANYLSHQLTESVTLPDSVRALVFFDDPAPYSFSPGFMLDTLMLPQGGSIQYVRWRSDQQVSVSRSHFEVKNK